MKQAFVVPPALTLFLVVAVLFASVGIVHAHTATKNGVSMSHSHSVSYVQPLDKSMSSTSSAQTPRGVIEYIFADVRLKDRCRNSNGTWQPWNQFAYGNNVAWWVYNVSASAQGTYQNCGSGHDYWNESMHNYQDAAFGVNETDWQNSNN